MNHYRITINYTHPGETDLLSATFNLDRMEMAEAMKQASDKVLGIFKGENIVNVQVKQL